MFEPKVQNIKKSGRIIGPPEYPEAGFPKKRASGNPARKSSFNIKKPSGGK